MTTDMINGLLIWLCLTIILDSVIEIAHGNCGYWHSVYDKLVKCFIKPTIKDQTTIPLDNKCMKLFIFLDIDGVLNSTNSICSNSKLLLPQHEYHATLPDSQLVKRLNAITDATGAEIVITSVWRKNASLGMLSHLLFSCGVTGNIVDTTKVLKEGPGGREFEIREFLSNRQDVKDYIVIDNGYLIGFGDHFIRINNDLGLSDLDVLLAIEQLTINID